MNAIRHADETCPAKKDVIGITEMVKQWLEMDMWNGIERSAKYLFKVLTMDFGQPVICVKLLIVFKRSLLTY